MRFHVAFWVLALSGPAGMMIPVRSADSPSPEAPARIDYLVERQRVIPLRYAYAGLRHTNVHVPPLVLTNASQEPLALESVRIDGLAGKAVRISVYPDLPGLSRRAKKMAAGYLRFRGDEESFGDRPRPGLPVTADLAAIPPEKSALLMLDEFVHGVGAEYLDALAVSVRFTDGQEGTLRIPLEAYRCKKGYRSPLRDRGAFMNNAGNCFYHRQLRCGEFAADIVLLKPAGDRLTCASGPRMEDHFIFGKEVLAIGDGVVTETGTGFPNGDCNPLGQLGSSPEVNRRLIPKIGLRNVNCGNYVVIDHGDAEFSFCCHLNEGSVRVKPGDRVRQGQVIAQVGHTGGSLAPHLHFHLMDHADLNLGNGLPVLFEDIPVSVGGLTATEANGYFQTDTINTAVELPEPLQGIGEKLRGAGR